MIIIFGASTDIGRRLSQDLSARGQTVRNVSRNSVDGFSVDLATGNGIHEVIADATIVVSCAHAKYTKEILGALPPSVERVILTGSAWCYSKVPNPRADQVREAESVFRSSGRDGVMLHPTMIYGGEQENNIIRLLSAIQRLPFIPAPGGGRQMVQPVYIDDVVQSLVSATLQAWRGQHVIPIGGQPLTWRAMVETCAEAIGCRRPIINVPAGPIIAVLSALNRAGVSSLQSDVIRRFKEDVRITLTKMTDCLAVEPRSFRDGIQTAIENWRLSGALT